MRFLRVMFISTEIAGVVLITPEPIPDERGFFAKTWDQDEFEAHGLARMLARNRSYNRERGTLRGMHFQRPPYGQAKLIGCSAGSIYDVALDLRRDSVTFGRWTAHELRAGTGEQLYVPEGFAHGYITLEPDTTVEYLVSAPYAPDASDGIRWDEPAFGISWPIQPTVMSARDRSWPASGLQARHVDTQVREHRHQDARKH